MKQNTPSIRWHITFMSDAVEAYKSQLSETAVLCSTFYNGVTKQRSYYLAPVKQACAPFHI